LRVSGRFIVTIRTCPRCSISAWALSAAMAGLVLPVVLVEDCNRF